MKITGSRKVVDVILGIGVEIAYSFCIMLAALLLLALMLSAYRLL